MHRGSNEKRRSLAQHAGSRQMPPAQEALYGESLTKELTTLPNAAPTMIPTAISSMLPRMAKSRNSPSLPPPLPNNALGLPNVSPPSSSEWVTLRRSPNLDKKPQPEGSSTPSDTWSCSGARRVRVGISWRGQLRLLLKRRMVRTCRCHLEMKQR